MFYGVFLGDDDHHQHDACIFILLSASFCWENEFLSFSLHRQLFSDSLEIHILQSQEKMETQKLYSNLHFLSINQLLRLFTFPVSLSAPEESSLQD